MELEKELKQLINGIKFCDRVDGTSSVDDILIILKFISDLCDKGGETQWSIKDQINLAIEELKF